EEENIFKFYSNDGIVWEISVLEDEYGKNLKYSYYGIFYKNEFPIELIEEKKKLEEEQYKKNTTECPKFIGMTIEEVKGHKFYNDFEIRWEYVKNEEYDIGIVCDQSETAAKRLKKGSTITLYISTGGTTVKVPDVYGKTESYAVSELKSKGFAVSVIEIANAEVEPGLVVKTDPVRTAVVEEGSEITVYISAD
ncbi:MAG: PASTA domain-containing protein, partial [Clostridia bacterium]|nr:PASTA domain-containing protein [Clostridia bacterium]